MNIEICGDIYTKANDLYTKLAELDGRRIYSGIHSSNRVE